jgi:hypothetical protein
MLIEKSDVDAHFASRIGKTPLHKGPVSQPDATGFSVVEIDRPGANRAKAEDSGKRPAASGQGILPTV